LRLKRASGVILIHAYWVSRGAGIRGILDFGEFLIGNEGSGSRNSDVTGI
jgi:hypothetical protein